MAPSPFIHAFGNRAERGENVTEATARLWGAFVPAAVQRVIRGGAAWEGDNARALWQPCRYEEPNRKLGQAVQAKVLRPRLGPELDPALHRVRHVVLLILESFTDPLWVGAKVFEDVWIGTHRVAKHGRLSQFAQWYRPVTRENHVIGIAVGEVVIDRTDDDGVEVHEECDSGESWHFLAPQHHLLPLTERADRVWAAEFR